MMNEKERKDEMMNHAIEIIWKISRYFAGDERTDVVFCKRCKGLGYEHYRKNNSMQTSQLFTSYGRIVRGSLYDTKCEPVLG